MSAEFDLHRFVEAQDGVHEHAFAALPNGRKRTHWMWFVFPQLAGLGRSEMAQHYAMASLDEARAYLAHPVLGPRLQDCTALVNVERARTAHEIFGSPDDLKFRSCMTLFDAARPEAEFRAALEQFFGGQGCPETLRRLAG